VAFDGVHDTVYTIDSSADQIVAYDTTSFVEKFRLNIGEAVAANPPQFDVNNLVASSDGHYLALSTASGVRLFSVPTSSATPPPPTPSLTTHRGMVFDHAGTFLYLATSTGYVERYNLSTNQLDIIANPGGSLNGIDIAPDDSFVLVGQYDTGLTEGLVEKVNLANGQVTNITFSRSSAEGGVWDIVIASNGSAFFTTDFNGSGWVPLRQINLATNTVTARNDMPNVFSGGTTSIITERTQVRRSADRTRLYFLQSNISNGPVFHMPDL